MSSADVQSSSTSDDALSNAERERWILAIVIAFAIITTITVLAFVLQRLLYLRALAADALNTWRPQGDDQWPAVDRAASLYAACRRVQSTAARIIQWDDDIYDDEHMAQTTTVLTPNERAGQLAARLAARYQDGAIFWLDAAPFHGGESKRRLRLDINRKFLSLDEYGLDSKVLVHELNTAASDVDARYSGDDEIGVVNQALLPFLEKVLLRAKINMAPYLAWEFARHKRDCFAPYRVRSSASTEEDSCFDCVERVAGLAAHAPFLRASADVESRAKVTLFVDRHIKGALLNHIIEAQWLSNKQKELMVQRLYWSRVVRGVPAGEDGVAKLNAYYADLPPTTGYFWRDLSAATSAAWQRTLKRSSLSSLSFPLLSAEPNVLTGNDTVYVPAVYLVPPLFNYGDAESGNYGFLGVALVRALVHRLGLTGLVKPPEPEDSEMLSHMETLSRCLRLNRESKRYPYQLADLLASGPVLKAFDSVTRSDSETRKLFVGSCLLTCSGNDPLRCDLAASQTTNFAKSFYCLNMSLMAPATRCTVW
ncbi:hypothetical protein MTO96_044138 [Rhipicephalus appendiculatus]